MDIARGGGGARSSDLLPLEQLKGQHQQQQQQSANPSESLYEDTRDLEHILNNGPSLLFDLSLPEFNMGTSSWLAREQDRI
jgi:hypothetical protein